MTKIKGRNVLFILNASNRYTIAMTDIEPRNWNYYTMYISRVIHGVMQGMGYSEEQITQYFKMSGDMIVTKTHGKKSVGGINRMVMDAQYFDKKLEKEAKYQWELSEYLNRDICQPEGFDAYGYPSELFKLDMERLGIIPKRKPAKVIDFTQYKGDRKNRLEKYKVTVQTKYVVFKIKALWNSSENNLYGMDKKRAIKCIQDIENYDYVQVNNSILAKAEIPFLIFERNRGKCFIEMY